MELPSIKKPNGKQLLRWLGEAALLLSAVILLQLWQARDTLHGAPPPLSARLLTGEAFSIPQTADKPLLVYFWATWCPVCNLSSDNIDEMAKHHQVITIAMQSGDNASIASYMRRKGLDFPVIADPEGHIAETWHVRGVPTLYFLDSRGKIRYASVGYTSLLGMKTRLWLAE